MIRMAVIGAGLMGGLHARNYASLGDRVRVTHVYDPDRERAEKLASSVGGNATADLDSALDRDVDAVTICVPPVLNRELAERAFSAGKHVFLEKPIALTLADADAIIAAAERSGRQLMIGLVLRFWPGYGELHRQVVSGRFGRPLVVTANRLQAPAEWGGWLSDYRQTGGIAPMVLVHDFDQINWLLGQPLDAIAGGLIGAGVGARHVWACVHCESGSAIAEASTAMPQSYPFSSLLRCVCERGVLTYTYTAEPSRRADGSQTGMDRISAAGAHVLTVYTDDSDVSEHHDLAGADLWQPELLHFLDSIEQHRAPEHGTAAQARSALSVALAVNRSLESGLPERI